jgi:CTP:phosphocholine cytidylyltransferase-like protein
LQANGCSDINIIGGYKIDSLKNKKDINVIYYQNYESTSEANALEFALDKIYQSTELFIMFGDVFVDRYTIRSSDSYILTNKKKHGIGCYCYNSNIIRMSFDADDKWAKVVYLNKDSLETLRNVGLDNCYFIYEAINKLIDNKCVFKQINHTVKNIETKRDALNANICTKT